MGAIFWFTQLAEKLYRLLRNWFLYSEALVYDQRAYQDILHFALIYKNGFSVNVLHGCMIISEDELILDNIGKKLMRLCKETASTCSPGLDMRII